MENENVNKFINGRYLLSIAALLSIGLSYVFFSLDFSDTPENVGLCSSLSLNPIHDGFISWGINVVFILGSVLLLGILNKRYAFIREYTMLHIPFFLIATFSHPDFSCGINSGVIVVFLVMLCALILFGTYQQPKQRGLIFLIAFILSAFGMVDYSSLFFLPVFFVGCLQMQVMTFKGFIAMLLGIITPYWLVWGFGLLALDSLRLPDISLSFENYMKLSGSELARAIITLSAGMFFGFSNVLTLMSYRLQLRSYNGFFTVLALSVTILMIVDIRNFNTYLMLLNICVAVQAAHFFTIRKFELRYLLFFLFIVAYLACMTYDLINFIG